MAPMVGVVNNEKSDGAIGEDLNGMLSAVPSAPMQLQDQKPSDLAIGPELYSQPSRGHDDEGDDCVVLNGDPDLVITVAKVETSAGDGSSDELQIISEKGPIACRDFPHARHLCSNFPYSSTSHVKHCTKCYCFVCDIPAPCASWGNGASDSDHCHATGMETKWKLLRQTIKIENRSANASSLAVPGILITPRAGRGTDNAHICQSTHSRVISGRVGGFTPDNSYRYPAMPHLSQPVQVTSRSPSFTVDEEGDDCIVLDGDPDMVITIPEGARSAGDSSSDELQIISEKGPIACRDFPHARHLCSNLPYSSTSHVKHCTKCYCFVCDIPAPCASWGNGALDSDHCHANGMEAKWKLLREAINIDNRSANASSLAVPGILFMPRAGRDTDNAQICQNTHSRVIFERVGGVAPDNSYTYPAMPHLSQPVQVASRSPSLTVDEEGDDCIVLDGDPDMVITVRDGARSAGDDGSDELQIISEKGPIACRDFPHARHLCSNLPYSTTSHEKHCAKCYCFVCETPAPCTYWGNRASASDHCHATDMETQWTTKARTQVRKRK